MQPQYDNSTTRAAARARVAQSLWPLNSSCRRADDRRNMTPDPAVDGLRNELLPRLKAAWDTDSTGSLRVGDHGYIQWGKWPEGMQIECSSGRYAECDLNLSFVQRRMLGGLDMLPPSEECPNYYRRYDERSQLGEAAGVLAQIATNVLPHSAQRRPTPSRPSLSVRSASVRRNSYTSPPRRSWITSARRAPSPSWTCTARFARRTGDSCACHRQR